MLKVHAPRAWFTLDLFGSGHFVTNEWSEEREPVGKGWWENVASRASKSTTLLESLGQPYLRQELQSTGKEPTDHRNPEVGFSVEAGCQVLTPLIHLFRFTQSAMHSGEAEDNRK